MQHSRFNSSIITGVMIVISLLLIAIFAPLFAPFKPDEVNLTNNLQFISSTHLLGTDELGRDILSRIIYGSRYVVYVICLAGLITGPLGLVIGIISGYFGGVLDLVLMRITDIFLALPKLILALALVVVLGPGFTNAIIAIAITSWCPYAKLARANTMLYKHSEFIQAIKLQGASNFRIIIKHILPLCLPSLMLNLMLDMSGYLLSVSGLSFLGLGAQPPAPEWGAMIAMGRTYILNEWWLITFPGIAIAIVSFGLNLLSEGLRDLYDPRYN